MKSKLNHFILIIIIISLAVAVTSFYFLVKNKQILLNPLFVSPEKDVVGVDISHYQGGIDYEELATQSIKFAYIKATEGSSYVDEHFAENWEKVNFGTLNSRVLIGAYHFFSYESDGEAQAKNYITAVGDLGGRLIPAIDLELYGDYLENPPETEKVVTELKKCLNALQGRYNVKPMIYAERDIYDRYLASDFTDYPLWMRNIYYPLDWTFHHDWTIWQYTDRGELSGYSGGGYIDLNVLNKNKTLQEITIPF